MLSTWPPDWVSTEPREPQPTGVPPSDRPGPRTKKKRRSQTIRAQPEATGGPDSTTPAATATHRGRESTAPPPPRPPASPGPLFEQAPERPHEPKARRRGGHGRGRGVGGSQFQASQSDAPKLGGTIGSACATGTPERSCPPRRRASRPAIDPGTRSKRKPPPKRGFQGVQGRNRTADTGIFNRCVVRRKQLCLQGLRRFVRDSGSARGARRCSMALAPDARPSVSR